MKLFVIAGGAHSGKDTLAGILKDELNKTGSKAAICKITDPLYGYATNYFSYNKEKDPKPRKLLQELGIEIIKEKMGKKTFLLDRLKEDIEIMSNFFDTFIIADTRLIDELIYFKNNFKDVVTIKIERENYDSGLSVDESKHLTERDLDRDYNYDYFMLNKDIEKLKKDAIEIVSEVK